MGLPSIMSYLEQLLKGQQPCFRMKIMFVGQENVGYVHHRCLETTGSNSPVAWVSAVKLRS